MSPPRLQPQQRKRPCPTQPPSLTVSKGCVRTPPGCSPPAAGLLKATQPPNATALTVSKGCIVMPAYVPCREGCTLLLHRQCRLSRQSTCEERAGGQKDRCSVSNARVREPASCTALFSAGASHHEAAWAAPGALQIVCLPAASRASSPPPVCLVAQILSPPAVWATRGRVMAFFDSDRCKASQPHPAVHGHQHANIIAFNPLLPNTTCSTDKQTNEALTPRYMAISVSTL